MEDNKLIADFMGVEKENGLYLFTTPMDDYKTDTLYFDISWDWLMPVIKKMADIRKDTHYRLYNTIDDAYNEVVEFIKYYNNENK